MMRLRQESGANSETEGVCCCDRSEWCQRWRPRLTAADADGAEEDQRGIGHFGGGPVPRADAVFRDAEYPVVGILPAVPHEIGRHRVIAVGSAAQQDAPSGIEAALRQHSNIRYCQGIILVSA